MHRPKPPPPRAASQPPESQSQYLSAAEFESPATLASTLRLPTPPAASRTRRETFTGAEGPSSESSLDPGPGIRRSRRRAASTGALRESVPPSPPPVPRGVSETHTALGASPLAAGLPPRSGRPGPVQAQTQSFTEEFGRALGGEDERAAPSSLGAPFVFSSTTPVQGAPTLPPFGAEIVGERRGSGVPRPPHLPPLTPGLTGLTAYANWDVATDVEWSLAKVVGPTALAEVMKDPEAFDAFRAYVATMDDEHAPHLLDLYRDLLALSHICTTLRLSSSCISSTYFLKTSPSRLPLPLPIRGPVLECLYDSASAGHPLLEPLHLLHAEVYDTYFQPFVQQKLVQQVVTRLASWKAGLGWTGRGPATALGTGMGLSTAATDGLAESYCLSDPFQRDTPITLASEGFARLTGYPLDLIVGRNCRFLQGPGTTRESVKKLHEALDEGRSITSLIFNYRRDGSAFANLLCMVPLKDEKGVVRHVIGGQIDVTGALQALVHSPSLAARPTLWPPIAAPAPAAPAPEFTPLVHKLIGRLTTASRQTGVTAGEPFRELAAATLAAGEEGGGEPAPEWVHGAGSIREGKGAMGRRGSRSPLSFHGSERDGSPGDGVWAPAVGAATPRADVEAGSGSGQAKGVGGNDRDNREGEKGWHAETMMQGLRASEFTYSRLALVSRSSGDIMYTTPELVEYCGLPASTHHELHSTSFTKILLAPSSARVTTSSEGSSSQGLGASGTAAAEVDKERTRRVRRNVQLAVEGGHPWTGLVGLKPEVKKLLRNKHGETVSRDAVLHFTPLCNKEGTVEAFVAVFG